MIVRKLEHALENFTLGKTRLVLSNLLGAICNEI